MDGLGRWTEKAASLGVKTNMDFLDRPDAQEAAMTEVLRDYDRQLSAKGLDQHIGKEYDGLNGSKVLVTRGGLIAAGHREGMGATSSYLRRRAKGQNPTSDDDRRRDRLVEKRIRDFSQVSYTTP